MTHPPIDPAAPPPEPPSRPGGVPGAYQPGGPPYDSDYPPYRPGHASVPPASGYSQTGYPSAWSDAPVTAVPEYWSDTYPPGPDTPGYQPSAPPGYPPGPPPQFVQPRRRSKPAIIAIVATIVTVLLCGACGLGGFLLANRSASSTSTSPVAGASAAAPRQAIPSPSPRPTATRAGSHHTVAYEVTGAGNAIITFGSSNGISHDQAKLPWHKEVTVQQDSFLVSVLALALGGQQLTCRVLVDGKQVAGATSDTAVTCTQLITR